MATKKKAAKKKAGTKRKAGGKKGGKKMSLAARAGIGPQDGGG